MRNVKQIWDKVQSFAEVWVGLVGTFHREEQGARVFSPGRRGGKYKDIKVRSLAWMVH